MLDMQNFEKNLNINYFKVDAICYVYETICQKVN